jgi:hypothetical protein
MIIQACYRWRLSLARQGLCEDTVCAYPLILRNSYADSEK